MRGSNLLTIVSLLMTAHMGLAACTSPNTLTSQERETPVLKPSDGAPIDAMPEVIQIRWFVPQGDGVVEEEIAAEFNASQNAIDLIVEIGPGGSDSARALWGQIETGDPPDIVGIIGPRDANKFPDMWLSVDDLLAGLGDINDFEPAALEAWRTKGELIGIPVGIYPTVLFYNRDLFEAAGLPYPPHTYGEEYADGAAWTFEKMEEIGMQLTLDGNDRNAHDLDFDPEQIVQWGFLWGGDLRGKLVFFGPGTVVTEGGRAEIPAHWREAVRQYYAGMWEKHYVVDEETKEMWTWNSFGAGAVAMGLDPLWYLFCCTEDTNWDIAAVPSYKGVSTARLEHDMIGILGTTEHPREAAQAAYFIASNLKLNMAWGAVPARRSLQTEFLERIYQEYPSVNWQVALDSVAYADIPSFDTPMPNYLAAWDRMEDFADLLESTEALDVNSEIEKLETDLQAIFDKDALSQ